MLSPFQFILVIEKTMADVRTNASKTRKRRKRKMAKITLVHVMLDVDSQLIEGPAPKVSS